VGRPSKCTRKRIDQIAELVRDGVPMRHAARAVGIGESTIHAWIARGTAEDSGIYRDLMEAVTRAQAESIAVLVARVSEAARTDWRAAAWLLTRRAPFDFIDPAKRHDLQAAEARTRVIVTESQDRLDLLGARRQIRQEMEDDGRES